MIYAYPCDHAVEDDGDLAVTFPDVPAAITSGADRVAALSLASDALATALAAREPRIR